jgi:Pyruvate flavodoxin/ferredoxin oxidoreductase, thiamine diP-bdg
MAMHNIAISEELVAPWEEWSRRYQKGRRLLEAGTYALTEGAIAAGCRVFAGYPITPATDIAEYMSKRLPQVGGYYVQAEDELAGMHMCAGASLGGLKAMTATSGPGYTLLHDGFSFIHVRFPCNENFGAYALGTRDTLKNLEWIEEHTTGRKADGSESDFKWETGIKHDASNSRPEFSKLLRDLQQRVQERMAASGSGKGAH